MSHRMALCLLVARCVVLCLNATLRLQELLPPGQQNFPARLPGRLRPRPRGRAGSRVLLTRCDLPGQDLL